MRILLPTLSAVALLAACTGGTPSSPMTTGSAPASTETSSGPALSTPSPSPTPLISSARLMVDGHAVQLANSIPGILGGAAIAVSNGSNGLMDRSYSLTMSLRDLTSTTPLTASFKPEQINRAEMSLEQVILGRSNGNRWNGVFDVPSDAIKLNLANTAGRLMGTAEVTLKPADGNEPAMKKDIRVKYEFENAIQ